MVQNVKLLMMQVLIFTKYNKILREIHVYGLYSTGLYDKISGSTLEEETGIFYQEEAGENPGDTTNEANVPEANMTTKRVIRYTIL